MTEEIHVYSDPGHAWMKVPLKRLTELGIAQKISQYSFVRDGFVYLEEDCDAAIYVDTIGGIDEKRVIEHDSNVDSEIRGFDRYDADRVR